VTLSVVAYRVFLGLLLLLVNLSLAGCESAPRTVHYRLTVEIETSEGKRTGTGVVESKNYYNDGLLRGIGNAIIREARGEAVIIDLAERGLLFVLLVGDPTRPLSPGGPGSLLSENFTQYVGDGGAEFYDRLNQNKPKMALPAAKLPMMVRFRDIDNPMTVERVHPETLSASFGDSVKFMRADLEITNDAVTTGIGSKLKWLAKVGEGYLGGGVSSGSTPMGLQGINFKSRT
jgi:hypothetical protein